jgi:hypothetical protein
VATATSARAVVDRLRTASEPAAIADALDAYCQYHCSGVADLEVYATALRHLPEVRPEIEGAVLANLRRLARPA